MTMPHCAGEKNQPEGWFLEAETELLLRLFLLRLGSRSSTCGRGSGCSTSSRGGTSSWSTSRSRSSVGGLGSISGSRRRSSGGGGRCYRLGFFFLAACSEGYSDERSNEERLFHFIPFIGEECCDGYLMYLWLRFIPIQSASLP